MSVLDRSDGKRLMIAKTRRRTRRVRNEMRLWLRTNYGHRISYTQKQIDIGREELGFRSVDDAFIAYSLFGVDLSPSALGALESTFAIEDLSDSLASLPDAPNIDFDCLGDS